MIIVRSPLRITLGGGGTDLASYYRDHEGFLVSAAIDKYVYITLYRGFHKDLLVKYSKMERVNSVDELEHPIVREAIKSFHGVQRRFTVVGTPAITRDGKKGDVMVIDDYGHHPAEVEATLLAIAGIREAAVIGVPDEVLGFAIKAFVVLEPGAGLDAPTIQRECRARLESFKVPTYVELCTALPRSSNGKIQKAELARAHTQED